MNCRLIRLPVEQCDKLDRGTKLVRWPLKNQILVRMLILLFVVTTVITLTSIRSTILVNRELEANKMAELTALLSKFRFPLSSTVLDTMKSLSGAEFAVSDRSGVIATRTSGAPEESFFREASKSNAEVDHVFANHRLYNYSEVKKVDERNRFESVHIFIPRQSTSEVWWQASKTPLITVVLVFPIAILLSVAFASQVTKPLQTLRKQVHQIAKGHLTPIDSTIRNDEIRDLNHSINEMTEKLKDHEDQVRQNERLDAVLQMSHGVAHQVRNSAAGCKIAVELIGMEASEIRQSENYHVALRQLDLINSYVQKFFLQSKNSSHVEKLQTIDLEKSLEQVMRLLMPTAKHMNVTLNVVNPDGQVCWCKIMPDDAEQVMMNLIANAISAAAEKAASSKEAQPGVVDIALSINNQYVDFVISDNGHGPPDEIADQILHPFVTGSPEGTGLGLSVVKRTLESVGGEIFWNRAEGKTTFSARFPLANTPCKEPV
ncbi:MAG: HAMP domain-containing sensor histidine kinase [Planctomycetota bacterium]